MLYKTLVLVSAISFFFYSIRSIFSKKMIAEYSRWGMAKERVIISLLQFFASIGLIIGFNNSSLMLLTSFLLTLMMIFAIFVRIKIDDALIASLPAIFYVLLNLIICCITFYKL